MKPQDVKTRNVTYTPSITSPKPSQKKVGKIVAERRIAEDTCGLKVCRIRRNMGTNKSGDCIEKEELETNYNQFIGDVEQKLKERNSDEKRYESFFDRKNKSVLDIAMMKNLCHGKYMTYWKGMNIMKDCMDSTIYQQLFWYEKPKTIIELGAYTGACAAWMADTCRTYGFNDTHIYSVDIDLTLLDKAAKDDKDVTFISGDAHFIEKALTPEMLQKMPHPWVVIEDAHVNVTGVMEYLDKFMLPGDYFIVDDTSPDSPLFSGQGLFEEKGYEGFGSKKLSLVSKFMETRSDVYKVDTFYTDFFGYNGSFNWNSYIRKMK
eukprot:gene11880-13113_t